MDHWIMLNGVANRSNVDTLLCK